jgi:transposase
MLIKNTQNKREHVQMLTIGSMVPEDHLLRDIERAIDLDFIYDLVEDKYSPNFGRPSIDPVVLIKIVLIQHLYGIRSMRQTIKEIEVNVAYRWFLGLDFTDKVPHFTTFGKNYTRRFKGTDLFEQIFENILAECVKCGFVDMSTLFVDGTHIKAHANNKKKVKAEVKKEALFYEEELQKEIAEDRKSHGKKPLKEKQKDKDDDDKPSGGDTKISTQSTTDPESGMFHKGEHKQVFAYVSQTACDRHGWITDYEVYAGNNHDSRTFGDFFKKKLKGRNAMMLVMDAGYKTPAIAKLLMDDGITPVLPYTRPMTKRGFFKKIEYVYDEQYDCYICPNNQELRYSTTNRKGYREYKSNSKVCANCPYLEHCTHSKNHVKLVTRHVWQDYLDECEEIRHSFGYKEIYAQRKETIERVFGEAKENHGLRFTQSIGKAQMRMKVGLTFACINLKKLAKMKRRHGLLGPSNGTNFSGFLHNLLKMYKKRQRTLSFAA